MNKKQFLVTTIFSERFLQSLILIAISIIFFYSVISKEALQYVHTRYTGIIIFSGLIFFVISVLQFWSNFFDKRHDYIARKKPFYLVIFLIPVFCSALIPRKPLTVDSLAFSNELLLKQQHIPKNSQKFIQPRLLELHNGYVVMNDDSFGRWLPELYLNLDSWVGKKIKVEGAVWKNSEVLAENEFAIGRMMMVCCAADMQPAGLIATWENASSLDEDDWVRVTGVITKMEYENSPEPFIVAETVEKITRPSLEYVYPF